jgi:hypothetical protein
MFSSERISLKPRNGYLRLSQLSPYVAHICQDLSMHEVTKNGIQVTGHDALIHKRHPGYTLQTHKTAQGNQRHTPSPYLRIHRHATTMPSKQSTNLQCTGSLHARPNTPIPRGRKWATTARAGRQSRWTVVPIQRNRCHIPIPVTSSCTVCVGGCLQNPVGRGSGLA